MVFDAIALNVDGAYYDNDSDFAKLRRGFGKVIRESGAIVRCWDSDNSPEPMKERKRAYRKVKW